MTKTEHDESRRTSSTRAVVVAGGGPAASAWSLGLLTGLADAGLDLRLADLFVGTSSGSRVALHLAAGADFETAFERRVQPGALSGERPAVFDRAVLMDRVARARADGGGPGEVLKKYGAYVLEAARGQEAIARREVVSGQLPVQHWPDKRLLITAISAQTGARRAFDACSGISVVDAVIASTASFGWPPVLFQGEHFFDGGYYSTDNADLAVGADRVLILALKRPPEIPRTSMFALADSVSFLAKNGVEVQVVEPDERALAGFAAAGGLMSPAISRAAAIEGRVQGQAVAARISTFWAARTLS